MIKCIKCNHEKDESCFVKDSKLTSGYRPKCKSCLNDEQKLRRLNNLEQYKDTKKKYYQNNIEKMRLEKREYYKNNKESKAQYDVEYRLKNSEKIASYKKEWDKKRSKENIEYKIKKNLRRRIHHALKGNSKSISTLKLLGCTPEFFKKYLELQFVEGMNWSNYGEWHIDHIIPCFTFDLSIPEQQLKCFHYTNQRPLWKIDNLKRPKTI